MFVHKDKYLMINILRNNKIIRKADKVINNSTMTYTAHTYKIVPDNLQLVGR